MTATRTSKNTRLLAFLQTGQDITKSQAQRKFSIRNVSAHVSKLRAAGFPIYNNSKKAGNGHVVNVYRLGTPKRAEVAAGKLVLSDPLYRTLLDSRIKKNLSLATR